MYLKIFFQDIYLKISFQEITEANIQKHIRRKGYRMSSSSAKVLDTLSFKCQKYFLSNCCIFIVDCTLAQLHLLITKAFVIKEWQTNLPDVTSDY